MVQGEACTIQALDSDVQLQTPQGAHGVVFGTVHTNHQQFLHLISDSDCLICPVCEYGFHPDEEKDSPEGMFKLFIPHIVKDISKVKDHIKVREFSSKTGTEIRSDIPQGRNRKGDDAFWDINQKYLCIHSTQFRKFIVTVEGINCCAQSAKLLLYGSLIKQQVPTVTIKPYLGCLLPSTLTYTQVNATKTVILSFHYRKSLLITQHL